MNDTIDKTQEVLNDLIKINNDRIEGYETAIDETKDSDEDLRASFKKMISQSRDYAAELRMHAHPDGKEVPKGETTIAGKVYRAWMDVKTTVSGNSRASILSVCERGEDAAQNHYESALDTEDIDSTVRSILQKQKAALKKAHDEIRNWRDKEKSST